VKKRILQGHGKVKEVYFGSGKIEILRKTRGRLNYLNIIEDWCKHLGSLISTICLRHVEGNLFWKLISLNERVESRDGCETRLEATIISVILLLFGLENLISIKEFSFETLLLWQPWFPCSAKCIKHACIGCHSISFHCKKDLRQFVPLCAATHLYTRPGWRAALWEKCLPTNTYNTILPSWAQTLTNALPFRPTHLP